MSSLAGAVAWSKQHVGFDPPEKNMCIGKPDIKIVEKEELGEH